MKNFKWSSLSSPARWTVGIASFALVSTMILFSSVLFTRCAVEEVPEDPQTIVVPAHTETTNDVVVADVGSGFICFTQRGYITYRHTSDSIVEVHGVIAKEALGRTLVFYGKDKSLEYDPFKGTLTIRGGLPVEEDGTFQ